MRDGVDQPVGFQQTQGFADRGTADAHHLAQLALDQPLPRLQVAGHDGLTQFPRDDRPHGRDVVDAKR